jgi:hypothetical protein
MVASLWCGRARGFGNGFVCLPGADHCLTAEADVEQVFDFIRVFSRGYFPAVGRFVESPGSMADDCHGHLIA